MRSTKPSSQLALPVSLFRNYHAIVRECIYTQHRHLVSLICQVLGAHQVELVLLIWTVCDERVRALDLALVFDMTVEPFFTSLNSIELAIVVASFVVSVMEPYPLRSCYILDFIAFAI